MAWALDRGVLGIRMPGPGALDPGALGIGVLNIGALDICMSDPEHSTPTRFASAR